MVIHVLPCLNNPNNLDPDLDFWDCFGRINPPSYNGKNMAPINLLSTATPESREPRQSMVFVYWHRSILIQGLTGKMVG